MAGVEYDLPVVGGAAARTRVATLLDRSAAAGRLREAIVKALMLSVQFKHRRGHDSRGLRSRAPDEHSRIPE